MRMLSFAIVIALGFTGPAFAEKSAEKSFNHEGTTYVYQTEAKSNAKVISGRAFPGGKSFRLVVANGMVRGVSGGAPVSFAVNEAKPLKGNAKLSMR